MTLPCHGTAPGGKELLDISHLPEALTPWRELPWLHSRNYLLSLLTWCQSNPRDGVKGATTGVSHLPLSCWSPSSVLQELLPFWSVPTPFSVGEGPLTLAHHLFKTAWGGTLLAPLHGSPGRLRLEWAPGGLPPPGPLLGSVLRSLTSSDSETCGLR